MFIFGMVVGFIVGAALGGLFGVYVYPQIYQIK